MNTNTSRLLEQLIDRIMRATEPPGESCTCPYCGGSIRLNIEPFFRRKRQIFGVHARCEQCNIEIATDYAGPSPEWWAKLDSEHRIRYTVC